MNNEITFIEKAEEGYRLLTSPYTRKPSRQVFFSIFFLMIGITAYYSLGKSAMIGQLLNLNEIAYLKIHSFLICISFLSIISPFMMLNKFYRNVVLILTFSFASFFAGRTEHIVKKNPEYYMDYGSEISEVNRKKLI